MLNMPSGIYPEVSFPQIAVIVETLRAMGIRDVETVYHSADRGARRASFPGVSGLQAKTVRGASEIKIDLRPGPTWRGVERRERKWRKSKPTSAGTTTVVERQSPSVFPIISFVVTGGANPSALRDYAYYDLRPHIGRLDDVAYVTVQGGDLREIVIEADPVRLIETGLSISDVADHFERSSAQSSRADSTKARRNFKLEQQPGARSDGINDRVIAVKNGQAICLQDIGRVCVSHEDRSMAIRCNGDDAVSLTVFRRLGGNAWRSRGKWMMHWLMRAKSLRLVSRSYR